MTGNSEALALPMRSLSSDRSQVSRLTVASSRVDGASHGEAGPTIAEHSPRESVLRSNIKAVLHKSSHDIHQCVSSVLPVERDRPFGV